MIKRIVVFVLIFSSFSFAQFLYDTTDVKICNTKFDLAIKGNLSEKPIGDVIAVIGKSFLGTPYEAGTLEKGEKEKVIIHLTGLDCYTFFETSLALARTIKAGKPDFESYLKEIENLRYREGKQTDYLSRLHYAIDWLDDNQKRGIVKDITPEIGGKIVNNKVGFMSEHSDLYPRLKDNAENIKRMQKWEEEINKRRHYYIPQDEIERAESKINNGDIIFCTTGIKGLIVGHTGIAVKESDGRIHFLHAPLKGKNVQISEKPLSDYIRSVKKHTGIIVIRPLEPKN